MAITRANRLKGRGLVRNMGDQCKCGAKMPKKSVHKHILQLSNPGIVKFEAPARICNVCGEATYSEDDAKDVFNAFDKAYKQKNMR